MFERLLFAIDDDESLEAALPIVAAYAKRTLGHVRVLHVTGADRRRTNGAGRPLVDLVVERLRGLGARAEGGSRPLGRGDRVASVIVSAATSAGADLVVVGSHGRSDLGALFLGSVSHAVVSGLDAPVLVVRAAAAARPEPRVVLVAVDGLEGSDEAVHEAADVAEAFGARLVVVHVRQLVAVEGAAAMESDQDASSVLANGLAAARRDGLEVSGEIAVDPSVPGAITAAARRHGADLVVLGSRRPNRLSGLLLGSVGHAVVNRLRCPVLIARHVRTAPVAAR